MGRVLKTKTKQKNKLVPWACFVDITVKKKKERQKNEPSIEKRK